MALLEVDNVTAGYGAGPDILNGLQLEIESGRSHCIVGPNGAGKSTLLKTICGILRPRSGEIRFEGKRVSGRRPDQLLAAGICFVPQEQSLFAEMTVRENLSMGGFLVTERSLLAERMDRVFEMYPILRERSRQLAGNLSGGEQQMVVLGRALMVAPKVLMIDEPSLGLAPMLADQIFETIKGFSELGITVILVEQNAWRGLQAVDWGIVLDLGEKRFEGPADGILDDPRIREIYLGSQLSKGSEQ